MRGWQRFVAGGRCRWIKIPAEGSRREVRLRGLGWPCEEDHTAATAFVRNPHPLLTRGGSPPGYPPQRVWRGGVRCLPR